MKANVSYLLGLFFRSRSGQCRRVPALAQTTSSTVEMKDFEVIAVNGDNLVFRDQTGARQITVPQDFRFTIDGKKMAVSELKPGMKGTAVVTTTTTVIPVFATEVRDVEVLRASDLSVTVRGADGNTRRYSRGELNTRGVAIYKDGKEVRIADLKRGDKLTAVIVTSAAPVVLTEQEVQAALADSGASAGGTKAAEPESTKIAAAAPAQQGATSPATSPAPSVAPPVSPPPSVAPAVSPPPETSGMNMTWRYWSPSQSQ